MFRFYVDECRTVEEATTYVEIFNYSVRVTCHCRTGQCKVVS